MGVSRRQFLHRIGAVGGSGAVYGAMQTMGLLATDAAAQRPSLPAGCGAGAKVVILGAGIAGLVNAYELERAGFDVTLIEARDRVGGRNWTIRGGTKVQMVGEAEQTCTWGEGMYFNAGPARLPSHHQGVLGYAKELGVPLEVEINTSRSSYLLPKSGPPIRQRAAINDTRGYVSELLAKAINKGALDQDMTAEEKKRLMPFLKAYGDLDSAMTYKGSERSGLKTVPGAADQMSEKVPPLSLQQLLENEQLPMSLFEENIDMQATMFQPVGGMDQIPMGFQRAIKSPILRQCEVTNIRQSSTGVKVVIKDLKTKSSRTVTADYAIITIPLTVLSKIDNNFDKPVKQAIASVIYDHSNKVAFETPRFWENDQIYGGISFVGGETNMVWYPSWGLHSDKAVLVACYASGKPAAAFAKRPLSEQIAMSAAVVERLHPGKSGQMSKPMVVNWEKIPYNLGPWPNWNPEIGGEGANNPAYKLLNQPHGRVYFSGAHLSQIPGWQEGAVLSAHRTINALAERTKVAKVSFKP
jgi:monoamine oxidase